MKYYKISQTDIISVLLPVLLGVLSIVLWLLEIHRGVGWKGLAWLNHHLYSVYLITGFSVLSYMTPIVLKSKLKKNVVVLSALSIYVTALGGFFASRYLFVRLYAEMPEDKHVWHVWMLILVVTFVAAVLFYIKQWYLYKSDRFHIMTLVAVFISVVPASLISVEWFQGYGNAVTFVDAVKMGYPMLWVNILLGWTAYAMVNKAI